MSVSQKYTKEIAVEQSFNIGKIHQKITLKPRLIGVGGNSGSGKTTLVNLLDVLRILRQETGGELEEESPRILTVDGDDGHKWQRGAVEWSQYTHLNPEANELETHELPHLSALKNGDSIQRRHYDHTIGVFTDPKIIIPEQIVIYNGLHTLYLEQMRKVFDLTVFMAPDETLRTHRKICRDMKERGYDKQRVLNQIRQREVDTEKFIVPQAMHADVITSFYPSEKIFEEQLGDPELEVQLNLRLQIKGEIEIENLIDVLNKQPGLRVIAGYLNSDINRNSIDIAGHLEKSQIFELIEKLLPDVANKVKRRGYSLRDGLNGIMQIVILYIVHQRRKQNITL